MRVITSLWTKGGIIPSKWQEI